MRWPLLAIALLTVLVLIAPLQTVSGHPEIGLSVTDEHDTKNPLTSVDVYQGNTFTLRVWVDNKNETGEDQTYDVDIEQTGSEFTISPSSATLDVPGHSERDVWVNVTASMTAPPGAYTLNITVTSQVNSSINTSMDLTVNVNERPSYGVKLTADTRPIELEVGPEPYQFTLTVENEADVPDTITLSWTGDGNVTDLAIPQFLDMVAGESRDITVSIYAQAEGSTTIEITATSAGDPQESDSITLALTVKPKPSEDNGGTGLLDANVMGIPLVALFVIVIVVPIGAVVAVQKKKAKKKEKPAAPPAMPGGPMPGPITGMAGHMPGAPGPAPGYGAPQPMVMHCPNCGGVIEIANPAMPQMVQCMHCGSQYNFPGTGQAPPPAAPPQPPTAQPGYGAAPQPTYGAPQAAMQQTPCPACGTPIPVPPQRPVTVQCPGCGAQYNINQ